MFRPATVFASVHVRAGPGGKQWPARCCVSAKKILWQEMSDINNEGQQHHAGLQPAPDSSDDAYNDASQLQEASAEKPKRKSQERVWESMEQWDRTILDDEFINNEIARLAKEKIAEGGISSLFSRKKKDTDLSCWKYKDRFINPDTGLTVCRYRCPLDARFKCLALLKTVHTQGQVEMYMADMHGMDSHVPEKDTGKYLKFHQMEVIKSHVKINPSISAAHLRRNIHRTSPEKKIAPQHAR